MATAKTLEPDSVARFCRQYLQLERELDFPESSLLREELIQSTIYDSIFADGAVPYPPPPRYQLRVLKELVSRIENSIEDWEQHGVSDDLMGRFSEFLASPLPSEADAAQQKSYVTYYLSLLSGVDQVESHASPDITLLESRSLISASGTTGLRTWEAALHLGQYLSRNPTLIKGKGVLELGAGTGYISILCAKYLSPRQVIASDGSDDVVANLPENFFVNGLQGSGIITAMDLKWGYALVGTEEAAWNGGKPIDVVLGADVTYDESVIPSLVGVIGELFDLYPAVKILIAATERNRKTYEAFLRVCEQRGFKVREIEFDLPQRQSQTGPFYNDQVPIRICEIATA
ncbi:FAM86A [Truncatella angustata]|uniref:FAM86A n=1 Tax=Truncatella angustata TaxID=152316 RepID=A0A9P9A0I7_9PEZI|nr:FAM86A [Truncatella angustata]KAH6656140.1 FAM86A [Truncatella angustata]